MEPALNFQACGQRVLALVASVDVHVDETSTLLRVDSIRQVRFHRLARNPIFRVLLRGVTEQVEHVAEIGPPVIRGGSLALRTYVRNATTSRSRECECLLVSILPIARGAGQRNQVRCRREDLVCPAVVRVSPSILHLSACLDLGSHFGARVLERYLHLSRGVNVGKSVVSRTGVILSEGHGKLVRGGSVPSCIS